MLPEPSPQDSESVLTIAVFKNLSSFHYGKKESKEVVMLL